MNVPDEMKIALSKKKLLLLIAISAVFVAVGIWLITIDSGTAKRLDLDWNMTVTHAGGWISVIFFGLCGIICLIRFFDKKPGLEFTKMGVIDNASGVSAGLIPWSDILGADVFDLMGQRTLVVKVINPDRYIEACGPLKGWAKKANTKLCGSPITIPSSTLDINFDELMDAFKAYMAKYGVNA